ncbi:unnamed protein product [Penicillium discolor]
MSTDDERPEPPAVPRTRAELRAAREAEERAAEEQTAAERAAVEQAEAEQVAEERAAVERMAAEVAAEQAAVDREAAEREAAERAAAERAAAERAAEREAAERAAEESAAGIPAIPQAPEPVFTPAGPTSASRADGARDDAAEPGWTPTTDLPADDEAPRSAPWSRRRFLVTIGAVVGVLVLVGTGLGIVSLLQGPRVTDVQVDAAQAIESSGSRVILTANQPLSAIDPEQVTVEPSVPFTVDAAGRGVGVRFTVPLDDDTTYTVTVAGVTGAGGGPAADLTTSFETPSSSIFLLRRDPDGDDIIFRTDLTGENAQPVFSHPRIDDFRATSTQLVAAVEDDDQSRMLVMDRDGSDQRELPLPGEGYSDRELSDTEGRASVLVTQSLSGDDEPRIIEVGDEEVSVFVWQFVPDSAAALFIDFDGALSLVDQSADTGVQSLGLATTIQGISRGTYTAIVERLDGSVVELDLADGSEEPLAPSEPDYGSATSITPFPGGTLRHVVARDEGGLPVGQAVIRVDDSGAATPLVEVSAADSILQACASPSGQYAAVVIAPDMADNAYDGMLLPLPEELETHLIDMKTGDEIVALTGFDASWCQTAPRF